MFKRITIFRSQRPSWYWLPILMGLFQSTLIAATPKFISTTGLSTTEWSVLLSMPTLFFLVLAPKWGRWSDRRGARYIIRFSALGLGLSIVLLTAIWWLGISLAFAPWLWFITIAFSRILYGMSASGVMPVCQSLAIESSEESRGSGKNDGDQSLKKLGFVSASLSIGRLCGPVILVVVASQIDWLLTVYCVLAIPLVWNVLRYSQRASAESSQVKPAKEPPQSVGSKDLWLFFALAFCVTLFVGYLQFVLGPLFLDWLADPDKATFMMSVTLTLIATTALICQLMIVKRLNWRSPSILVALSLLLTIVSLGLSFAGSPSEVAWLMIPAALAIALITPIYSRFAMSLSSASKGQISGKLAVAHTAGYPLGSLFAGVSYGQIAMWWLPLAIIAGLIVVLCGVVVILAERRRQEAYAS